MSNTGPYGNFELQYLSGKWQKGNAGRTLKNLNPYNEELLVEIPMANAADLDQAMWTAKEAQKAWALTPGTEKAGILFNAIEVFKKREDEIKAWLRKEGGATHVKAHVEYHLALGCLYECATYPSRVHGSLLTADASGKESRIHRVPVGVIGVISPWNFPLILSMRSVAPALALGNAVVLKPASDTPVTGGLLLAKVFEEAGLAPGLLSVVIGAGSEIGDAFVKHPVPRIISFTGSTEIGKRLGALAAESPLMKRLALELGGNSPFVVLDDANLDDAVKAAVFGKFLHQGQICMAINRIIVDAKIYDAFVEKFTAHVRTLVCGNQEDPATNVGPVINAHQRDGLVAMIAKARKEGFRELVSGEIKGQVVPPHVFADVDPDSSLAKEEIFGPIAPIIKARDEAHALEIANNSEYGLSSSVFTQNLERGARFALKIEAGMTHVNDIPVSDLPNAPFGGEKNSGIGRFNGEWILEEFTTLHWITVQDGPHGYPF